MNHQNNLYLTRALVLGGLLGCGEPTPPTPPSDATLYTRALSESGLDTEQRLALCAQLREPDRSAECAAGVVSTSPLPHDERCPRIPEGRWRDECWFKLAEQRGPRLSPQDAADACRKAGAYLRSCVGHVQSHHVLQLHASDPAREEVDALAAAWEAALGEPAAFANTWQFYWELELREVPDPARCEAAVPPEPCAEALAANHRAQVRHLIREDRRAGCDQAARREKLMAAWRSPPGEALRARLDDVERNVAGELCGR